MSFGKVVPVNGLAIGDCITGRAKAFAAQQSRVDVSWCLLIIHQFLHITQNIQETALPRQAS